MSKITLVVIVVIKSVNIQQWLIGHNYSRLQFIWVAVVKEKKTFNNHFCKMINKMFCFNNGKKKGVLLFT